MIYFFIFHPKHLCKTSVRKFLKVFAFFCNLWEGTKKGKASVTEEGGQKFFLFIFYFFSNRQFCKINFPLPAEQICP